MFLCNLKDKLQSLKQQEMNVFLAMKKAEYEKYGYDMMGISICGTSDII